jgi:hypothetical protein
MSEENPSGILDGSVTNDLDTMMKNGQAKDQRGFGEDSLYEGHEKNLGIQRNREMSFW